MDRRDCRDAALSAAAAIMALAASGLGLFLRGDGSVAAGTSVRGEGYEYALTGVYKWTAARIVAEGIGWDIATFFVAAPAALVAAFLAARGSRRASLLGLGLMGYFAYQFLEYAAYWAYNPLFLLYVAAFATSLGALASIARSLGSARFAAEIDRSRFPRRSVAALLLAMASFIALNWLAMILPSLGRELPGLLLGQTTLVVQALDLGLVVPLAFLAGISLVRGGELGYLLGAGFLAGGTPMLIALASMLAAVRATGGQAPIPLVAFFSLAAAAAVALTAKTLSAIPRACARR